MHLRLKWRVCTLVVVQIIIFVTDVSSQCTFNTTFASSSWHDNTRGTITFGTTTMTGWSFTYTINNGKTSRTQSTWQCHVTSDTYLILRTPSTITHPSGATVYAYLCLKLTNISDVSFMYYQQHVQNQDMANERLKISGNNNLSESVICDETVTVPVAEYHVLVKSGFESSAAIECPNTVLFKADYTFHYNGSFTWCDTSQDMWDVCTNTSEMTFDYSTCSTEVAYSAGGRLWCVASVTSGDVTFVTVYNQDSSIVSTTRQFSCICTNGVNASVAPNNCSVTQSPSDFAKEANQKVSIGHVIEITQKYEFCGTTSTSSEDDSLTAGEIAAIVISVLLFIFMVSLGSVVTFVLLIYFGIIFLILMIELSGILNTRPLLPKIVLPDSKPDHNKVHNGGSISPSGVLVTNGHVLSKESPQENLLKPKVTPRRKNF